MKLYISGPMTGIVDFNFPAFFAAEELLRGLGYEVVNPARVGYVSGWKHRDYLKRDIPMLLECDGVALLDGYEDSKGCRAEIVVAEVCDLEIRRIDEWCK